MKNIIVGVIILALLSGGLIFALRESGSDEQSVKEKSQQQDNSILPPEKNLNENSGKAYLAKFTYTNTGFEPLSLSVKSGTPISVINNSSKKMQFSSNEHPTHQQNTKLNLKSIEPGESTTFTPTENGTWGIHDHIDSAKSATLIVTE